MSYLYWIHLPTHTDIMSEGYIGVSNDPKKRFDEHKFYGQNPHLTAAFNKYKDIIHTILLRGSKEYCYDMEEKIRPISKIGWNINKGGSEPPSAKGKPNLGVKKMMLSDRNPMNNIESRTKVGLSKKGKAQPWVKFAAMANARDYLITNPQNETFQIHNLSKFAKENNLSEDCLLKVSIGKHKQHKGWKCERLKVV